MSPDSTISSMFDAVYAAPLDVCRRRVLADVLLERGEPRGEFIALQLDTSARSRKRAQKLLNRHRLEFLGPLRDVLVSGTDTWAHGFVVRAELRLVGARAEVPALSTIESLVGHLTHAEPRELASPCLRGLRSLQLVPVHSERYTPSFVRQAEYQRGVEAARRWLARAHRGHVLPRGAEWAVPAP
jgi:uncharacterized protein (TIGR02996 family)